MAASRTEDEFGVAQLSGSNARVISTLLSTLLAIESAQKAGLFYTKSRQHGNLFLLLRPLLKSQSLGASFSRVAYVPHKAAALSDVVRVSLHVITEAFASDMLVFRPGSGPVPDDQDWLPSGSPAFGTRAAHIERLRAILDFRE
jgi:nucleoporin NDC1